MPTPIPGGEKAAFIAIVKISFPNEALIVNNIMNNYEDIPIVINRMVDYYTSYPQFLNIAMSCFDNAALLAAGIYFNQTIVLGITNPALIINSNITGSAVINLPNNYLNILSNSSIDDIVLDGTNTGNIWIGSGSVVNILDASDGASSINAIFIKNLRNNPSTLKTLFTNSNVGPIMVDDGAYYYGDGSTDTTVACANPVTDLAATNVTYNAALITWSNPASTDWLFVKLYYKEQTSESWLEVNESVGQFVGDTGFSFNKLKAATYYNFKVITTCINGGLSIEVTVDTLTSNEGT